MGDMASIFVLMALSRDNILLYDFNNAFYCVHLVILNTIFWAIS